MLNHYKFNTCFNTYLILNLLPFKTSFITYSLLYLILIEYIVEYSFNIYLLQFKMVHLISIYQYLLHFSYYRLLPFITALLHHLLLFAIWEHYYPLLHLLQIVFAFITIYSIITGNTCWCRVIARGSNLDSRLNSASRQVSAQIFLQPCCW